MHRWAFSVAGHLPTGRIFVWIPGQLRSRGGWGGNGGFETRRWGCDIRWGLYYGPWRRGREAGGILNQLLSRVTPKTIPLYHFPPFRVLLFSLGQHPTLPLRNLFDLSAWSIVGGRTDGNPPVNLLGSIASSHELLRASGFLTG